MSEADCAPRSGWAPPNQWKAWLQRGVLPVSELGPGPLLPVGSDRNYIKALLGLRSSDSTWSYARGSPECPACRWQIWGPPNPVILRTSSLPCFSLSLLHPAPHLSPSVDREADTAHRFCFSAPVPAEHMHESTELAPPRGTGLRVMAQEGHWPQPPSCVGR